MKKKQLSVKLHLNKITIAQLQHTHTILGGDNSSGRIFCQNQCATNYNTCNDDQCTFNSRFVDCLTEVKTRCTSCG